MHSNLVITDNTIDRTNYARIIEQYRDFKINDKQHYYIKTYAEHSGTGLFPILSFKTPDTITEIHAKSIISPDTDCSVQIYEGATIDDVGTIVPSFNNHRRYQETDSAELLAYIGTVTTNDGSLIWSARSGGSRKALGVSPAVNYDIIAKRNTWYIFKLTQNIAGDSVVDIDFFWFEDVPK